jgi:hypothetical protein
VEQVTFTYKLQTLFQMAGAGQEVLIVLRHKASKEMGLHSASASVLLCHLS